MVSGRVCSAGREGLVFDRNILVDAAQFVGRGATVGPLWRDARGLRLRFEEGVA